MNKVEKIYNDIKAVAQFMGTCDLSPEFDTEEFTRYRELYQCLYEAQAASKVLLRLYTRKNVIQDNKDLPVSTRAAAYKAVLFDKMDEHFDCILDMELILDKVVTSYITDLLNYQHKNSSLSNVLINLMGVSFDEDVTFFVPTDYGIQLNGAWIKTVEDNKFALYGEINLLIGTGSNLIEINKVIPIFPHIQADTKEELFALVCESPLDFPDYPVNTVIEYYLGIL